MSWIKLTGREHGNEIAVHSETLKIALMERVDGYTFIVVDANNIQVKETIDEIIAKLEGNKKDSWIENTGVQPCANNRLVAVLFADGEVLEGEADNWVWEKGDNISVVKYKFK